MNIDQVANKMKRDLELAITDQIVDGSKVNKKGKLFLNGAEAKQSLIRSSKLINYVHEFVKHELIRNNVEESLIFPPLGQTKPEIKLTGMFKQKDQDVCVKPQGVLPERTLIEWGPMINSGLYCDYGGTYAERVLSINVRSQLSSLDKNSDTLFERMFAEALNLHELYPKIVMGEVYVIPVYEYDDQAMINNQVKFKSRRTNLEKYINFFHYLSGRDEQDLEEDKQKYERCALVIIDFRGDQAKVYKNTAELKARGLVRNDFEVELAELSTDKFIEDLLLIYNNRFPKRNEEIYDK
ncbi:hypothetical protein [Enterococcus lactis]|uniref:hypothetical protein n=1 Tax=Enterococcus lactis TaxID=357441 RepID=UPI001BD08068|nr:hypothetical protein [Enterococcus lactis]